VPREFTLKPGERQTVRIMARIGSNVAEGDYHTHVRFLEDVTKRDELNQRTKDYDFSIPADLPQGGTLKFSLYDSDDAGAKPIKVLTAPLS